MLQSDLNLNWLKLLLQFLIILSYSVEEISSFKYLIIAKRLG